MIVALMIMAFCAYRIMKAAHEMLEDELKKIDWGANEYIFGKFCEDSDGKGRDC